MTRMAVIGMAFIIFALAGCADNRKIQSLRNTDASLADEIAFLNTRLKAVEDACLQLNSRLVTVENRSQAPAHARTATASPDSSRPAQDDNSAFLSKPELSAKPTRSSFSQRVVGMTITETLAMLGKPDNVSEESGAQKWVYNNLKLATESGGEEPSPALLVFEQGCVARAVLTRSEASGQTEKNQSSPPKESEASNAVVQTGQ